MTERRRTREDIKRERQKQQKKTKKSGSPIGKWIKRIVLTIVLLGVLGFVGGAGLFAYYVSKQLSLIKCWHC